MTEIPAEQLITALREQNAQLAYQVAVLTAQARVLQARLGEEATHE
ncbi:hypothetical protein [Bifidobacterium choerinum]|uniref:Transposase n=1 Tax=Bifidobacterium choerinum TaxID=35760 RepID=A0A087AF56_9BIFI|nr:hypothetical protein [Bifidobacterium choerinum]KFI57406.1 hypothetical protein BCHO_0825 [Bifidobacterium choerinum]